MAAGSPVVVLARAYEVCRRTHGPDRTLVACCLQTTRLVFHPTRRKAAATMSAETMQVDKNQQQDIDEGLYSRQLCGCLADAVLDVAN